MKIPPEQHEEIIRRYQAGESSVKLAKAFGVGPGTVLSLLRKNGAPVRGRGDNKRKIPPDREQEICQRYQAGESANRLAKEFGVTQRAILWRLEKNGISKRSCFEVTSSNRIPAEHASEISQRYQAGESTPRLAKAFGVSVKTIRRLLKRHGVRIRSLSEAALNWREAR